MNDQDHPSGGSKVPQGQKKPPCQARNRFGQPCKAWALPEGQFCAFHEPSRAEQVRAQCVKGGQVSALQGHRRRLDSTDELVKFTSNVIHDAREGAVPIDVARVVIYGVSVQKSLLDVSVLEQRLQALEERVAAQSDRRGQRWSA